MSSELVGVNGFEWNLVIREGDRIISHDVMLNKIPSAGMAFLVRAPFGDVSPITSFYLGLFQGDYIPSDSTTAADIPGNMNEFVAYAEEQRPLWDREFDGSATMDNANNKARFTPEQDRVIRGAFLCSEPTKGGNSGLVLSCVRFPSPKQVYAGQTAELYGGLTYIGTNVI